MKNTAPEPLDPAAPCRCGSGRPYGECCGPLISGERIADSAEALMRARFSAHATGHVGFIHRTYRGTAGLPLEKDVEIPHVEWTKLVIHKSTEGNSPGLSYVDFTAYGSEKGTPIVHHEKAEFAREGAGWIYTRPVREGPEPVRAAARVGRNDPCPCGSGKKFKHCCGNPART